MAISAVIAGIVAIPVFFLWYPAPLAELVGGKVLFALLVGVDVVLGPLLTGVVAAPRKPVPELRRDIALVALLQCAGLAYGLHVMAEARPVLMAFEVDRFRVVTAAEIDSASLSDAPAPLRELPWAGPRLIAAVKPTDPKEQFRSVELGLAGIDLSMVPANWRDYTSQSAVAWARARPVQTLIDKYAPAAAALAPLGTASGQPVASLRFLPLQSRRASWVTVMGEPGGRIVGYLPFDGFF